MPWHSADEPDERQRSIAQQRALFQAQPPERQRETMERVRDVVARYPDGWLARYWREIYQPKGE